LNSKKRRKAWAESLLETFKGHELLVIRRKTSVDPVYERLCGFAERPVPTVAELEARDVSESVSLFGERLRLLLTAGWWFASGCVRVREKVRVHLDPAGVGACW